MTNPSLHTLTQPSTTPQTQPPLTVDVATWNRLMSDIRRDSQQQPAEYLNEVVVPEGGE